MLKRLTIKNTFKHSNTTINFEQGFSAIVGRNESGKTMILEMVSYSLFGTKMLRGKSSDYGDLHTELEFQVLGEDYEVIRNKNRSQLFKNGNSLVTGTKEVNAAILRILGFNEKVFLIANYAQQNQVTALSDMKPTERKKMVDSTIGMDVITAVEDEISIRASVLREQLKAIGELPEQPLAPLIPEGYVSHGITKSLTQELAEFRTLKAEKDQITGWLSAEVVNPGTFELRQFAEDLDEKYKELCGLTVELSNLNAKITKSSSAPPIDKIVLEAQLEAWDKYTNYIEKDAKFADLKTFIPSTYAEDDLLKMEHDWHDWIKYQAALSYYEAQTSTTCPACDHTWRSVEEPVRPIHDKPLLMIRDIETEMTKIKFIKANKDRLEEYVYFVNNSLPIERPQLPRADISKLLKSWEECEEAESLKAQQQEVVTKVRAMENIPFEIQSRNVYSSEKASYKEKLKRYDNWIIESEKKKVRLLELGNVEDQISTLQNKIEIFSNYENTKTLYDKEFERWQALITYHAQLSRKQNEYSKVLKAMKELRVTIKDYLVPSLNKVASNLLYQMTGGERASIAVDSEFEILVDNQPINTLSGSGKAIANLAIRIALGQVLINKKFSIFMGDEIDGDMDEERATWTASCLQNLSKHISQLILISHKNIEADNYIKL